MNKDILKEEYLNHGTLGERRKFSMLDVTGRGGEVAIEVNWNKLVRKKGYIKLTIGDEEVVISREHLYAILFMIGSAEEQEKMVSPFVKETIVTKFFKLIGVTAMEDIKKGDTLNVPLEFTLNPETNQVTIGKGSMDVLDRVVNKELINN